MRWRAIWVLGGAVVAASIGPAAAQEQPARKVMHAVRVDTPPVIDGRLDDEAWTRARWVSDLLQKEPVEGGQPTYPTEVAILYDRSALYVGARMRSAGPHDIEAVMTRRDVTGSAERIIISLDTFRDRRTAYSFAVTAAGVRADWYHPDDAEHSRDHSFDAVWQAEVSIGADGWTAEMRIPFSQLRFPAGEVHLWGININRYIPQRNEDIFWIYVPKDRTGWSSWFGELRGIEDIARSRRIELLPYVAGAATLRSAALIADDDPFSDRLDTDVRAGVDLKMGLGPSLTLDATINPDFGQVEADPAVVNLTAFETSFGERRPFFIEGGELLRGNGPSYFYSRRIGAAPRAAVDADLVELPEATPIAAAAKVTGRLRPDLSIGALAALTRSATARTYDRETGAIEAVTVAPITGYGVLRAQKELDADASVVGATFTSVVRDVDGDLSGRFPRHAHAGGADALLRSRGGTHELGGHLGFSMVDGSAEVIEAIQRSSAHYFQRPDQDHVRVDPERNTLLGWTAALRAARRHGSWRWHAGAAAESPGFELNDAGLLHSADDITATAELRYRQNHPVGPLHRWDLGVGAVDSWNFGGHRRPGWLYTNGGVTWRNFWSATASAELYAPGLDDVATRGGPLLGLGWGSAASAALSSSFAARTQWNVHVRAFQHQTGGSGVVASAGLTLRPVDRLQVSLSPRYFHITDNRQYLRTEEGGGEETYGRRYLFATVVRSEVAAQLRAQYGISPNLLVELYAEPFASSGSFSRFGELPAPRSRQLRTYGADGTTIGLDEDGYVVTDGADVLRFPDPDFTILSLRSTAVLRWELRPGSTLFVVWQQSRFDWLARGTAASITDLGAAVSAPGEHTIAVKLSYWVPVD